MGFFKRGAGSADMTQEMRAARIEELELRREVLNSEIEAMLLEYQKKTGDKRATLGAKKIGKQRKDYTYWHKRARKREKNAQR